MPSNGISNADLLDLTLTTLANLPDLDFEVALDYQDYVVCNQWFRKDKIQIDSGTQIERNIILDDSGNARFVRLYQKTPINVADVHNRITAPWTQLQTHWSIERREALRNRAPARYIDLLKSRRVDAMLSMANMLDLKGFSTPSSSSDDLNPRGLPYWLSFHANGAITDGFNGYTVRYSGGTTTNTKGNIDGSSETKWRNWVGGFSTFNNTLVRKMREAFHASEFRSPMLAKDLKQGPASKFRIYMGREELVEYEDLVTNANDNLGRDLDPFHGATTFRRVPIIHTPQLNDYTVVDGGGNDFEPSPIYGVNHNHFYPFVLDGDWLREDGPMMDVEQHNVMTTFVDCSFNFFCNNVRQGGFVLHKPIPSS